MKLNHILCILGFFTSTFAIGALVASPPTHQPTEMGGATVPIWAIVIVLHILCVGGIWFLIGRDRPGRGVIIPDEEILQDIKPYEAAALLRQGPSYEGFLGLIFDLEARKAIRFQRTEVGGYLTHQIKPLNRNVQLDPLEKRVLRRLFQYPTDPDDSKEELANIASLEKNATETRLAYNIFYYELHQHLVNRGWFQSNILITQCLSTIILLTWTCGIFLLLQRHFSEPHLAYLFLQIPLLLPIVYFLPRLTVQGALAREKALGLKRYIEVAEKQRLAFHENPDTHRLPDNALLPYAVAMGIQNEWKKYFITGYQESQAKIGP